MVIIQHGYLQPGKGHLSEIQRYFQTIFGYGLRLVITDLKNMADYHE